MKKTLIALSIASMAVSSIATAASLYSKDGYNLDIYGRVQGVVYSSNAAECQCSASLSLKLLIIMSLFNGFSAILLLTLTALFLSPF